MPTAAARLIRDLLEPCAGKLASTVLRGRAGGNTGLLPDIMIISMARSSQSMPVLKLCVHWQALLVKRERLAQNSTLILAMT